MALQQRPSRLLMLGFLGGPRLDQALANVFLLIGVETPAVLLDERNECVLVRPGGVGVVDADVHDRATGARQLDGAV